MRGLQEIDRQLSGFPLTNDAHSLVFLGAFYPVAPDLTVAEARRSQISAFGIEYEGKTGLSHANFSWAA